jgi:hypothetical protein
MSAADAVRSGADSSKAYPLNHCYQSALQYPRFLTESSVRPLHGTSLMQHAANL